MKTLLALLMVVSFSAAASGSEASEFMCGIDKVSVYAVDGDLNNTVADVNGTRYLYMGSEMTDLGSKIHRFGKTPKAELRITYKGRVAFRTVGQSAWSACIPLVLYQEGEDE